jgi:uncharacterized lipoprotein YehR (DUF1307 family)
MRRIDIINAYLTLGKVRLNKVEDKAMRNTLVADHLKMFRVARENDEYVASLQRQFDPAAVKEINEAYDRYAKEEINIELEKIDREAFADMIASGDIDLTLAEVVTLQPLLR